MKTMPARDLKARCLRVMEQVRKTRQRVVITKRWVVHAPFLMHAIDESVSLIPWVHRKQN